MADQLTTSTEEIAASTDVSSSNGQSPPTKSIDERLEHRRRRWPALVAGAALGCAATLGIIAWSNRDNTSGDTIVLDETVELNTVGVEQRDLIEEVDWSGTFAAGAATSVLSPTSGTITAVTDVGGTIGRGDVVARVDDLPIVAFIGSTPFWRDLSEGDEGADVLQLETNLAALGFNVDGDVTLDGEYTSATTGMVEAWQESLGVDGTGDVAMSDVVIIPGESTVTSSPAVGSSVQNGAELTVIETLAIQLDVIGWEYDADTLGTINSVADVGTPVEQGTVLYTADGVTVVAVVERSAETEAVLDAFVTSDIEHIESVLRFIGFDPNATLTIDDDADLATAQAVILWQQSIGLPETGSIEASDYVIVPDDRGYTVETVAVSQGDQLADGKLVMTLGSPTLSLTAEIAITEIDEFEVGDMVTVEQVDETTFAATVNNIADTTTASTADGEPTVLVTFTVTEPPEEFVSGTVTITTESERIDGAVVVPTRALITLREGGFAVETSNADGTTTLVAIEIGTFDDGVVEVTSGDIAVGDLLVVPS